MSSPLSKGESSSGRNTDRLKKGNTIGSKEGKEYEKITLVLLAERGYELSKNNNSQFREFAIGREVGIREDNKLDDIVFKYEDNDSTKNFIFVQIKHKQNHNLKINSKILLGSWCGNMVKDFNLRKYFMSYLNIREELKATKSKELKNGKISYVAIFTNIGLDEMELKYKGIGLKEAPDDIKTLFSLKKSSLKRPETNHCYQLCIDDNVSEDLSSAFKKCSDLHRIAKDFAQYVVSGKHKDHIMGIDKAPIKFYHVALGREVIKISNKIESSTKQGMKNKPYCIAKFRIDFIDNNKTGAKKQLLESIFEAIRELKPKEKVNDDEIKEILRHAEWRVVPHFGDYLPKKRSELSEIAKVFAEYVNNENEADKIILGKKGSLLTHYEVAFEREVIIISDEVKYKSTKGQNVKRELYCDAKFRDEFIDCKTGPKQDLKKVIFEAIMESDISKKYSSDYELENILRRVELKVDQNFGKCQNFVMDLSDKWPTIKDDDIKDFLNCFVLFVNQPNVTDLLTEMSPVKDIFLLGTPVGEVIYKLHQKFRDRIEKSLGIYNKNSNEEVWLSGEQIIQFVQELQDAIHTCVTTFMYEDKVMQYGRFKHLGKLASSLDSFLNDKWNKVLCVCSPTTLLTTAKVLQYLDKKNYGERISIELDDLKEIRDRVEKAFSSENNKLLIIECRHTVNEQTVDELCRNYSNLIKENHNKKIIIICKQNESILAEKFRFYLKKLFQNDCDPDKLCVQETDDVNLKDFDPLENPIDKEAIVFLEQKEKMNLSKLTGFEDWDSYIDYLSKSIILNKADIADIMIKILTNDEIEVGKKPLGTSSLEGAYATLFEEINSDSLSNKLLQIEEGNEPLWEDNLEKTSSRPIQEINSGTLEQSLDNDADEIYVFDGIEGSHTREQIGQLTKCLGLCNEQEVIENMSGSIGSNSKIQVANDQFTDENFKQICHNYPNKKILWISVKYKENELKFTLREFYNPNFYLKRQFKFFEKVIIKTKVKEQLTQEHLSQLFIFHCVNYQQKFSDSLKFTNDFELKQFQVNCESGKIKLCTLEDDVEAIFQECCRQNETVHWLKFENEQIIWHKSHGSLNNLRKYIDKDASEITLKEDDLIKEIKERKFIIISDDPGMGKTTTLTELYESKNDPDSFTATHWIIRIYLKDHLQAIRDIKLVNGIMNAVSVVEFLSKVEAKLNQNLPKSLLEIALDKNTHFSKHLLLTFDGFDEILNEGARRKIILLLKFLKEETPAKVWITTRLHYKEILENALSVFAIEFIPLNDTDKVAYIKKYLKDRLDLIIESKVFAELFAKSDETTENKILQKYTSAFLNKMKSVFKENIFRFLGTPLQLYLMLEGSTKHFKIWIENDMDESPNFNYLGNDLLEVYEKFMDRKYGIYFKKMGINESVSQEKDKFIFDQFNKDFAVSLILKSNLKNTLEKFKHAVLSAGIIKSNGRNIEFIHTTFREYFAAKEFIHWIKEVPNELSSTNKQEYVFKEILNKTDYQMIRTFINLKLKKITEPELQQENLNHYVIITEKLLIEEHNPCNGQEETVLHIAVKEGNTNIAYFLINILERHRHILKRFLLMRNLSGKTALHLACIGGSGDLIRILLDAASRISEDTNGHECVLKEFLFMRDVSEQTALHLACSIGNSESIRILLDAASEISENTKEHKSVLKEFIFMRNVNEQTALHLACSAGNSALIRILLDAVSGISEGTKGHKSVLKDFLCMRDETKRTAVHLACCYDSNVLVEILLAAGNSEDTKEHKGILKDILCMRDGSGQTALHLACCCGCSLSVEILLKAAARISEDFKGHKTFLKEFLCMRDVSEQTALHLACSNGSSDITRTLLDAASEISEVTKGHKSVLKEFLLMRNVSEQTALHLACNVGSSELIRILLDAASKISGDMKGHKGVLEDFLCMRDETKRTALHLASCYDSNVLVEILLAVRNSEDTKEHKGILKDVLCMRGGSEQTALHLACYYGCSVSVKILLEAAAKISGDTKSHKGFLQEFLFMRDVREQTALHLACSNGSGELIRILLDVASGISEDKNGYRRVMKEFLFMRNVSEQTALHLACSVGSSELIRILLDAVSGISEDTKGHKGVLKEFLCMRDETKRTALHLACCYDSNVLVEILLAARNSEDTKGHKGILKDVLCMRDGNEQTALHLACCCGCSVAVKILLDAAARISEDTKGHKSFLQEYLFMRDVSEQTALHLACSDESGELIRILLDAASGVSEDTKGHKGFLKEFLLMQDVCRETAMYLACSDGSSEIIKELIFYAVIIDDRGATLKELVTSLNIRNKTPFEVLKNGYSDKIQQVIEIFISEARINNDEDIANILQEINMKYAGLYSPVQ